jgi:hypothetical protein
VLLKPYKQVSNDNTQQVRSFFATLHLLQVQELKKQVQHQRVCVAYTRHEYCSTADVQ